jgi:hypothetical protein
MPEVADGAVTPPPPQAANAAQAANVVNFRPCRATFCFTFVS